MTTTDQDPIDSGQPASGNIGDVYEIRIRDLLEDHWQQWFEGMTLKVEENGETGQNSTLIIGRIADQPALHGLLAKIRDLNLTLISVRKLAAAGSNDVGEEDNAEQKRPRE